MNILKFSINKNCIMNCCNTDSWKYNEKELYDTIQNNKIEKVIIFTPSLNTDKEKLTEIINFIYNNFINIKIIIRTIFYRINIQDIIELTEQNFSYIEFILNYETNFFQNQLDIKNDILDKAAIIKKPIFIVNSISSNDTEYIKTFSENKLSDNGELKTDIIRINTDLNKQDIIQLFTNNSLIFVEEEDSNNNVINLNYYNCNNLDIYKNVYAIYINKEIE